MNFCGQTDATAFLPHVNKHAAALFGNLAERGVQLISAIAAARTEDIAGETFAVHAHERRFVFGNLSFYEREVMRAIEFGTIKVQLESAVVGRQRNNLFAFDQFLPHAPIRDQALDRANAQPMFFLELHQLRQARHRSVVVQNFAKHAGRLQSREARQIDRGFGVAGAAQNTAVFCAQRENVAGLNQISRASISGRQLSESLPNDRAR